MKEFKLLPNDPRLISLTYAQREFIIQSMLEDSKQMELASKGMKEDSSYEDKSFEKKFYSNKEESLLEGDEDLDEIYHQSLAIRKGVDEKQGIHIDYEQELQDKINQALQDKQDNLKNANAQVQDNWNNLLKNSQQFMTDEEE